MQVLDSHFRPIRPQEYPMMLRSDGFSEDISERMRTLFSAMTKINLPLCVCATIEQRHVESGETCCLLNDAYHLEFTDENRFPLFHLQVEDLLLGSGDVSERLMRVIKDALRRIRGKDRLRAESVLCKIY